MAGSDLPPRYWTSKVRLVSEILIDEIVLTAHQYTTGSITTTRNCNKEKRATQWSPTNRQVGLPPKSNRLLLAKWSLIKKAN